MSEPKRDEDGCAGCFLAIMLPAFALVVMWYAMWIEDRVIVIEKKLSIEPPTCWQARQAHKKLHEQKAEEKP